MEKKWTMYILQDCAGRNPSDKVYENDRVYAFHDIHPAAPVHFMLIPKLHISSLAEVEDKHRACSGR